MTRTTLLFRMLPALVLGGCITPGFHEDITDRWLDRELGGRSESFASEHRDAIAQALAMAKEASLDKAPQEALPPPDRLELDRPEAIARALSQSRRYLERREELDLVALSLREAQHIFEPQLTGTVAAILDDRRGGPRTTRENLDLGIRQRLPIGTELELSASGTTTQDNPEVGGSSRGTVNRLRAGATQPLLRGAGRTVAREPLTQAERNIVYAVRDFELFRQDFALEVLTDFYGLVQSAERVTNAELNRDAFSTLYRQSQGLYAIGRSSQLDVLRAEQELLTADNELLEANEDYSGQLDRFKVLLGIDVETEVVILGGTPEFVPQEVDVNQAIALARTLRLDLQTERELVEDARRQVAIAANQLLPDLDLSGAVEISTDREHDLLGADFADRSWQLGLSADLPLDRVGERTAYRRARITLDRRQRALELFEADLSNGVRAVVRRLRRAAASLEIQIKILEQEEKRVRIADLRHQQGEVENRDLVDANRSLTNARNARVRNLIEYELARLQLGRELGTLSIGSQGEFQ